MYTKQTWNTGDVITEEKLNHIEDGIANSGALIVHEVERALDKTFGEIWNAYGNGVKVLLNTQEVEGDTTDTAYYPVGKINYGHNSSTGNCGCFVGFQEYADYSSTAATLDELFNSHPSND